MSDVSRRGIFGLLASLPVVGKAFAKDIPESALTPVDVPTKWPPHVTIASSGDSRPRNYSHVYAWCGEVVTCENGHPVCSFTRTVFWRDMQKPGDLAFYHTQEVPAFGETNVKPCAVCGAKWWDNQHLFFRGRWN